MSKKNHKYNSIDPDEILIDSENIPVFNRDRFEGRLERPIKKSILNFIALVGSFVLLVFIFRAFDMQIIEAKLYADRSENNLLRRIPIFAVRGIIYDRNNVPLAWNAPSHIVDTEQSQSENATSSIPENTSPIKDILKESPVSDRRYIDKEGFSHVLGYIQYPSKDKNGFYYEEDFSGVDGVERYFDHILNGNNGSRLVEVDAKSSIISENIVEPAEKGENIVLSIDERLQASLFNNIKDIATRVGFVGGAGLFMDVHTGEILAMVSYPEYSSQVLSDKKDDELISKWLTDNQNKPFLDRAIDGLYTPGSIMKPFIALGVLNEGVIDPSTIIRTTGSITIPNPYDPDKPTIFRDWKNLGALDMRHAIAMSSDAYFYIVGGGYKDQNGLGILNIEKYLKMFGFGSDNGSTFFTSHSGKDGKLGTIPSPEWKQEVFNEPWYLGNTYHTSIGQYGVLITPMQALLAVGAIANGGDLLIPSITKVDSPSISSHIDLPEKHWNVIKDGMRLVVKEGTGSGLNFPFVNVSAKTGTAELGISKSRVNSWAIGYWPSENPKYAFATLMESGSVHNLIGSVAVMRQQFEWMNTNTPEYFK